MAYSIVECYPHSTQLASVDNWALLNGRKHLADSRINATIVWIQFTWKVYSVLS